METMGQEVIGMHEAKTMLSQLVQRAAAGETILIGPHGRAQVKLVAIDAGPSRPARRLGLLKGKLSIPADFDAELSASLIDAFAS